MGTPKDLFKNNAADNDETTSNDSGISEQHGLTEKDYLSVIPTILQTAASNMVAYTRYRAYQKDYHSPFAQEASQVYKRQIAGGKVDDITILIAVVGPK